MLLSEGRVPKSVTAIVMAMAVFLCASMGHASAQGGAMWRPVMASGSPPGPDFSSAHAACEHSWRSFNGNGPLAPNNYSQDIVSAIACQHWDETGGLDNSNGGHGTGGWANLVCPTGYQAALYGPGCAKEPEAPTPPQCDASPNPSTDPSPMWKGDPINIATGAAVEQFTDHVIPGPRPFEISRSYRSSLQSRFKYGLGFGWSFDHEIHISRWAGTWTHLDLVLDRGTIQRMFADGPVKTTYRSQTLFDAVLNHFPGANPYWVLDLGDGRTITFNEIYIGSYPVMRAQTIEWPDGYRRTYDYYEDTNEIRSITDSLGRRIVFSHTDNGRVARITASDGVTLDYIYDRETVNGSEAPGSERLIKVVKTLPGGEVFETNYHYEILGQRYALTGKTDARGVRVLNWDYDAFNRGVMNEHAGGYDRVDIAYDDANRTRTVTNAAGKDAVYNLSFTNFRKVISSIDGAASTNCAASNSSYVRAADGSPTQMTDPEGNVTNFTHNNRGLETSRTEGAGTPDARSITTEWHPTLGRPTKVTTPELETTYVYSSTGLLQSVTEKDMTGHTVPYSTNGQQRVWTYGYTTPQAAPPVAVVGDLDIRTPDFQGWQWTIVNGQVATYVVDGAQGRSLISKFNYPIDYEVEQTVDIPSDVHGAIDAGLVEVDLNWKQFSWRGQTDLGAAAIQFLDASNAPIGTQHIAAYQTETAWTTRSLVVAAPVGARKAKVSLYCDYVAGPDCDVIFDDIAATYGPAPGPVPVARPALLSSINGPLPGTSDTVNYEYDAVGNLSAVVNELGHRTEINSVNAVGQPTRIEDPNGLLTDLEYDGLNRLTKVTVNPGAADVAVTEIQYDAIGQITRIDLPHQAFLIFVYNDARLLSSIENALGEKRVFTYNALGEATSVKDYDRNAVLTLDLDFEYDELGRLMNFIGAAGQTAHFDYDRSDNHTATVDPRSNTFAYGYDALNRLISETDPDLGVTDITLRSDGAAAEVEDAENIATTYVRNGWGEIIREDSPNRGVTDYVYDQRGLLTQMTDARGQVTTYAYDAAGRIVSETHTARPLENRTYTYDVTTPAANKGLGRLASIADESGTASFEYDIYGRVSKEIRAINGPSGTQSHVLEYAYQPDDSVTRITYPSGREVEYVYAAHGPVSEIKTRATSAGTFSSLAAQITHDPAIGEQSRSTGSGGEYGLWSVKSALLGNGLTLTAGRDLDGRLASLNVAPSVGAAVQDLAFAYDPNSNILSITDGVDAARTQTFQYDKLNRLKQAVGLYGTIDYAYDLVGNRTALTRAGGTGAAGLQTASYSFDFGTHRLTGATAGGVARTLSYLSSGQLSSDAASGVPAKTFVYDGEGRMIEAREGGVLEAAYAYDAYGQRVLKTPASGTAIHYVYGPEGRLLAEHDAGTGAPLREYVWAGLMPVAMVDHSGGMPVTYYVHTDQVMQPVKMTDGSGTVVWDRVATPFGVEVQTTGSLTQNVRFPGQYKDSETGFFQNWNREYDSLLGRYVQSDPIGLMGGINTYAYVEGNPLIGYDPTGEVIILAIPVSAKIIVGAIGLAASGGLAIYGDDIAGGLIDGASSINDRLNTPSRSSPFGISYDGPIGLCRNTTDEGCDEEWEHAYQECAMRRGDPRYRNIAPWNMSLSQCARGLVSERCGGNRVEH